LATDEQERQCDNQHQRANTEISYLLQLAAASTLDALLPGLSTELPGSIHGGMCLQTDRHTHKHTHKHRSTVIQYHERKCSRRPRIVRALRLQSAACEALGVR